MQKRDNQKERLKSMGASFPMFKDSKKPDLPFAQRLITRFMFIFGGLGIIIWLDLLFNAVSHSLGNKPQTGEAWWLFLFFGSILLVLSLLLFVPSIYILKGKKVKVAWFFACIGFGAIIFIFLALFGFI